MRPHHQIPDQLLIQYFYEGLMPIDRSIIDAASEGALVDRTPEAARQLISNMAANSKKFGIRGDFSNKRVNEVSISNLENKVNDLTILFGRPFLKTSNTKIDCGKDTLSMEVGDEKIEFNFHDAMKTILSHPRGGARRSLN